MGLVFTVSNSTPYQNLSTPTALTSTGWNDFNATVPLGFMFHFLGDSTNTLYFDSTDMNTGTDLQFHTSSMSATPYNAFSMILDLEDRHNNNPAQFSSVNYQTDVVSGKKITKIEWKNAGLVDDTLHVDSLNAQLWIYENDHAVEYRIGNSSRKSITEIIRDNNLYGFKGAVFALLKNLDVSASTLDWMYYPSNLSPATMDSANNLTVITNPTSIGIDSFPKANTLLRWAPATSSGINQVKLNENITVYPTLVGDQFNIRFAQDPSYNFYLYNQNGQLIKQATLSKANEAIDVHSLATGNYFIVFANDREKIMYQITKQ
jgi:hypothetical protein